MIPRMDDVNTFLYVFGTPDSFCRVGSLLIQLEAWL